VAMVDLRGTQKALAKLSSGAQGRVQKLRCGWLPVNRQVSREDPDRMNGCSACSPSNLVEETVDHIFQCPCPSRRAAMRDRLAGMSKTFRSWKTSHLVIQALHSGASAWIAGQAIPDVKALKPPDSTLGELVHKAYDMLNRPPWGGIYFFEDSGLFPGVKHRNMNSLTALFTGGLPTMARVGQVEHRRGCSICLIWPGDC
jgi:hypothetical protein